MGNAGQLILCCCNASEAAQCDEGQGSGRPSWQLLILDGVAVQQRGGDLRDASPMPVILIARIVLWSRAPRWPFQLFLNNVPHHEGSVCAAHSDECVISAQEADAGQHARIDLGLVEFGTRWDARISARGTRKHKCIIKLERVSERGRRGKYTCTDANIPRRHRRQACRAWRSGSRWRWWCWRCCSTDCSTVRQPRSPLCSCWSTTWRPSWQWDCVPAKATWHPRTASRSQWSPSAQSCRPCSNRDGSVAVIPVSC